MPWQNAVAGLVTALVAASQATGPGASTAIKKDRAPQPPPRERVAVTKVMVGTASWYGPGFHGRRTASGEVFHRNRSTLASRSLPFGTRVRVTYLRTGRSAIGKVNDRGPFVRGRMVDLSEGLAKQIGLKSAGHGRVKVEVLSRFDRSPYRRSAKK